MDPGLRRGDTVFVVGAAPMTGAALRRANLEALVEAQGATRATPPLLLSADPYFDLAGEEFGRRLLLTTDTTGAEHCLRPDFTLPIVQSYIKDGVGKPAAFSYLGPIFRQRETGPAEFDQAGIERLAQPDGDIALDQVLTSPALPCRFTALRPRFASAALASSKPCSSRPTCPTPGARAFAIALATPKPSTAC